MFRIVASDLMHGVSKNIIRQSVEGVYIYFYHLATGNLGQQRPLLLAFHHRGPPVNLLALSGLPWTGLFTDLLPKTENTKIFRRMSISSARKPLYL